MTTNQILFGLGLVLVLAVGSQLVARRLGLPAIVVLLPAGFLAGIATSDVHPGNLLGDLYQPFVSLAVGVILFEAGLRLSLGEVAVGIHRVVERLVTIGAIVTGLAVAATVTLLFSGVSNGIALLIGVILVVSGPTVVLPLLSFIRPKREVRALLKWEGVLIDPIGAIAGVLVFQAVDSSGAHHGWRPGEFLGSVAVGALVGVAGAAVLYGLLREVHLNQPRMAVLATLMVVIAAIVSADLLRDDSGFVAATLMGVLVGNQRRLEPSRRIDVSLTREFHETLVQLLIGVLFVLIAASVSPADVKSVLPEAFVLVAVMVLLVRPAAVALTMWGSAFTWRERGFAAWMAPRGIVAGATASAFGLQLEQQGVAGAESVLPIVFVVIFCTVVVYGLTAPVVARWLGIAGQERGLVLVVGGHAWARELASGLKRSGIAARMWVGPAADQEAARAAGLDADQGRMMVDDVSREAELEEVTDALLLTRSDDFNALAAANLRAELGHGHLYRVAPDPEAADLLPPAIEGGILSDGSLTFAELERRFASGARFVTHLLDESGLQSAAGELPLLAVSAKGTLKVAVDGRRLDARPGDTVLALAGPP
ncbi:MAG: sodium:proton exchanger [Candidatus Rokuibacteriota bacterium]|nr:MAG: sodium:proton exchanger [Candidatus Rokubacteria bacterium]